MQCAKLGNKVDNPNSLLLTIAITSLKGGKDPSSSLSESPDYLK